MNPSAEPLTLYQGTFVATLSAIENVYDKVEHKKGKKAKMSDHSKDLHSSSVAELTADNAKTVKNLFIKYAHLFAVSDTDLRQTNITEHSIDTGTAKPIKQSPRRTPVHMQEDRHVDDMLKRGVIEECTSPWSSPVVLV
jgi:hypothetical protein